MKWLINCYDCVSQCGKCSAECQCSTAVCGDAMLELNNAFACTCIYTLWVDDQHRNINIVHFLGEREDGVDHFRLQLTIVARCTLWQLKVNVLEFAVECGC